MNDSICGKCGYINPSGSRFCSYCGKPIIDEFTKRLMFRLKSMIVMLVIGFIFLSAFGIGAALYFGLN